MSRRPYLAMTLLCVALAGARMVGPRETSLIFVSVTGAGCRVSESGHEPLLSTFMSTYCQTPARLSHDGWTTTRSDAQVGCSVAPRGCRVVQSGIARFVSCGVRMPLENGDRFSCFCRD